MEECNCEKRRTPYFIPKTAPPTAEGVEELREALYSSIRRAQPCVTEPHHALQLAIDLLNDVAAGASVSAQDCAAARKGLEGLLAKRGKRKTVGVRR